MLLLLIFIFLSSLLFWEWLKIRKVIQVSNQIKSSYPAFPFIGHGLMLIGGGVRRMSALMDLGREAIKHGGLTNMWIGRNYFLMVVDAKQIEVISKSCLEKSDIMRFLRNIIGNGSIFAPVSIWRPRRKFLAPTFSAKNLNNFVRIFSKQGSVLVDQLKGMAGKESFSIWNFFTSYTLDSVCETAFGVDVSAQKKGGSPLPKAFEYISKLAVDRMVVPFLHPDWAYKMLPYHNAFYQRKKILWDFVDNIIKAKRETLKAEGNKNNISPNKEIGSENHNKTFLDLLIESSGGEKGYSDLELQEETLVILLAGTDTSAVGASFTTMMLSRHQEVQDMVYQELQEVFGDSDRPLTAEDLPRLKYLEIVVKESLRLYPPVPVIVRKVEADVTLPSGVTLVRGCGVMFNIWGVHRNPQYWGEDAEVFRPERFLDALPSHPMAYMPFSCGPRNCLGYQYAMMSIKTAIASLLRRYRILPATNSDIRLSFDVMMKDADQFPVQLESRR